MSKFKPQLNHLQYWTHVTQKNGVSTVDLMHCGKLAATVYKTSTTLTMKTLRDIPADAHDALIYIDALRSAINLASKL